MNSMNKGLDDKILKSQEFDFTRYENQVRAVSRGRDSSRQGMRPKLKDMFFKPEINAKFSDSSDEMID